MAPRPTFIVGGRDGGKSTTLARLLSLPPWNALRTAGVLALATVEKTQYNLKDLETGEVRLALGVEGGPTWRPLGRFFYDQEVFDWANRRICASLARAELVVFDEIGRLELEGGGLAPSFGKALDRDGVHVVAVVRRVFVEAVKAHFGIEEAALVDVEEYGCE